MMLTSYHRQAPYESPTHRRQPHATAQLLPAGAEMRVYRLVVTTTPERSGQRGRALLVLQRNQPILDYLAQRMADTAQPTRTPGELEADAALLGQRHGLPTGHVLRMLPRDVRQPNPMLRPFVLRAARGEQIELHVTNRTGSALALALLDDDHGIQQPAGQPPLEPGARGAYFWHCKEAGIYPIYNEACKDASQHRCLLGVLMIEP